jgi:DNA polymerase
MHTVRLPRIGTAEAWRDAARGLLAQRVSPEQALWLWDAAPQEDLFAGDALPAPPPDAALRVPRAFVDLAGRVVWHEDPERFARLYHLLWRLRDRPGLMEDRGDADLARLRAMEKGVNRCAHKMKAFVRFRDIGTEAGRRRFAAWFEPTHHTVEPTAPFFTRRFADMDWIIATPDVTARFEAGHLSFTAGEPRPELPEDDAETLWSTYFRNIFNPARLKVQAMTSEMPRKYWKNLPEARHIPELIATADARARAMQEAAPSLPPLRAEKIGNRLAAARVVPAMEDAPPDSPPAKSLTDLRCGMAECTRCPLYRDATQVVPGEGPRDARLMVVGEQPGDQEDREGRPFVGPAGRMFDTIAEEAGLDRGAAYVTNAVKHFKFKRTGKRRLHQPPNRTEIEQCKWWLEGEIRLVKPELILSMGATALQSLTGKREGLLKRRGRIEDSPHGPVFVTVHPSFLLRIPDAARKRDETDRFRADLEEVSRRLA